MTEITESSTVRCELDARGVATVTLDRAEKHNAFDDHMIAELREIFARLASESTVRAMVLASTGRSFSAGGDLAWMQRMAHYDYGHNLDDARGLALMLKTLREMPQPTIARVQGAAFGGAVGLISCCDIAVAADTVRFGLTEARIGLIPATIAPYVIEAVGSRWARRLFTTAERFSAERGREMGLVQEVCTGEQLDDRVEAILADILLNSPEAVREAKRLVNDVAGRALDEELVNDTSARIAHIRVSEEGQEGLKAFLEKRKPGWVREERG